MRATLTDQPVGPPGPTVRSLRQRSPRYGEKVIQGVLFLAAALSVATTVGIVVSLLPPTVEFFDEVGFKEFFTASEWTPLFTGQEQYGVAPLVSATLMITLIAILVAVPLGLASAIYLSEYAKPRVRAVLKPTLEILAGIPTVVFGFFALSFITPQLQILPFELTIYNGLAAGLVMGVMIIPTIASLAEDAMAAVPRALREGAYALGSSRMEVSLRVVVPAALSGIVAAFVLGISRGVGETMIVLIAGGLTPNLTADVTEPMQTMAAFIAGAGSGDLATGTLEYKTIFAVGSLLFVMTLVMNLISIRLVRRFREVYE